MFQEPLDDDQLLVLDKVLSYLPPHDLLNARYVNTTWGRRILEHPKFPVVPIYRTWEARQRVTSFVALQHAKNFRMHGAKMLRGRNVLLFWRIYWPLMEQNLTTLDLFHIDIACHDLVEVINECTRVKTLLIRDVKFDDQDVPGREVGLPNEPMVKLFCGHLELALAQINPPTITKLVMAQFKTAIFPTCVRLILAARCAGILKELDYSYNCYKRPDLRARSIPSPGQVHLNVFEIIRGNAGVLSKVTLSNNTMGHELFNLFHIHRPGVLVPLQHIKIKKSPNVMGDQNDWAVDYLQFIREQQGVAPLESMELELDAIQDPHTYLQTIQQCTSVKKLSLTAESSNQALNLNFLAAFPHLGDLTVCETGTGGAVFDQDYLNNLPPTLRKLKIYHRVNAAAHLQTALGLQNYAQLTALEITNGQVTDAVFQAILRTMTNLEVLKIKDAALLTDAGLTGIHPEMARMIVKKKCYEVLQNADTMITRQNGVNMKNQLRGLRQLYLKGCKRISDVSLKLAMEFPKLSEVNLSFLTNVTDTGLNWLCQQNPQLTKIVCMHNRNVTNYGLNALLQRFRYLSSIHVTKEMSLRTLGELAYPQHPRYHCVVSVAKWNEAA